jgi:hypothetical protein
MSSWTGPVAALNLSSVGAGTHDGPTIDLLEVKSVVFGVFTVSDACTVGVYGSMDGTNWYELVVPVAVGASPANTAWPLPPLINPARYIRAQVVYGGSSLTAVATLSATNDTAGITEG